MLHARSFLGVAWLTCRFSSTHSFLVLPSASLVTTTFPLSGSPVSSRSSTSSSSTNTCPTKMPAAKDTTASESETLVQEADPYTWLEEVESEASLDFAKAANKACLEALGDPKASATKSYDRILSVLESDDRIPHVTQLGKDSANGNEPVLFNFWKDAQHPKGKWRKTSLKSYQTDNPEWTTVLNVDELAEKDGISWVWKGYRALPRARDSQSTGMVTRALLSLSRGGSDAVHVKEFDLTTNDFVTDQPFNLPEAKTRASYKSRDVLLVGTDFGEPDSMTDSGYPRTIREWVRGTPLQEAPVIFEGEKQDVSVSAYITDERIWNGGIYEVHSRSLTFYSSKYWICRLQPKHLLAPNDPKRAGIPDPPEFVQVDVQDDADIDFCGNLLLISLRSDWQPRPDRPVYKKGSVITVETDSFLKDGSKSCEYQVLFEPTERTAYEYWTVTKNYLVLSTMDHVQSKLEFFKIGSDGKSLTRVDNGDAKPKIRDCSVRPVDPYDGSDEFWFTESDYTTPSTLFLADATRVESGSTSAADGGGNQDDVFIVQKLKSLPPQYDSSNLLAEQRTATSKDGTEIPYFIVHNKDAAMDGKNPTLLYGYGGFEVSLGPHYIATAGLAWLERGGVYVEANIRGGGEFGPSWHQAALEENRNKCYEDFVAVAEHLISSGVCQPKSLAIRGGSNGGLLMGNMYTMRPDLWGAIHCAVPLLDMQRYHTLLAGASWMAEYGDPDTDDWNFLKAYSPYHNIDKDADYPPMLITTSTRDDRVHPAHARKMSKKLWDLAKDSEKEWKVFYYENIEGGHGGAADAKQSAFMTALAYDFMFDTLAKNIANESA